ncbi:hypothetical protein GCM10023259_047170 [Thermocatellispora tengchongensis]
MPALTRDHRTITPRDPASAAAGGAPAFRGPRPSQESRECRELVAAHLAEEFLKVPVEDVAKCVADVWACAEHLGFRPTPEVVERVAREHLLALVNSSPPSRIPR